jgi:hypothetical protein
MSLIKQSKLYYSDLPFEEAVDQRVLEVCKLKQYKQRTKEWYEARDTCITASSVSNVLMQSEDSMGAYLDYYNLRDKVKIEPNKPCSHGETLMDFVLSKCKLGPKFTGNQYTRWGQKYENVVSNIYSQLKGLDVLEFGLIKHPSIKFLGASPDGINTRGIMLEIKCPSSRKVLPYPLLYYWQQMQMQLICTNLQECHYFDAHFAEYVNIEDWENEARLWEAENIDATHHIYGMMMGYECDKNDGPLENDEEEEEIVADDADADAAGELEWRWIYAPPNVVRVDDFYEWEKAMVEKYSDLELTPVYYKLHEYHISKAEINYEWFNKNFPAMESAWERVEFGRTEEGMQQLKKYLHDKDQVKMEKRIKRQDKQGCKGPEGDNIKISVNISVNIDVPCNLVEPFVSGKSTYIHDVCLI